MNIIFKPMQQFNVTDKIGIHHIAEFENDIHSAFESAERDGFQTIYFYVWDLSLIKYARKISNYYNLSKEIEELINGFQY